MNPTTLLSLGLPALIAWSLADDYQKARIKRGLANKPEMPLDPPEAPLERVIVAPMAQSYPSPNPTAPSAPKSLESRKAKLTEVLDSHGLTPFYHLAYYPGCIRATGYQRSGKTTRIQCLALFRQLEDHKHPVMVATPHKLTAGDTPWPSSFSVVGQGNDWGAIRTVLDSIMQSLAKGETHPRTYILDEFSGYLDHGGMDAAYLQEFVMSMVRETAKHSCQVILLQHGDTVAMSGGVKGLQAAVWGNLPTLQCNRVLVGGKPQPAPEASIVGGGFPEQKLIFPDWLRPQWLLSQFPELKQVAPPAPDRNAPPQLQPDFTIDLPGLMTEDQSVTTDQDGGLPPHLAAVLDYLKRKGSATPRQIQQAKLGALTNTDHNNSQNIQLMLDSLVFSGYAQPLEDGSYAPLGVGQRPQ